MFHIICARQVQAVPAFMNRVNHHLLPDGSDVMTASIDVV